jgi:hypothetical protein
MKTAMQELIDTMTDKKRRMQLSLDLGLFRKSAYSQLIRPSQIEAMGDAIELAQSMLEKEKEQIIEFSKVVLKEYKRIRPEEISTIKRLYNETFNTNDK